MRSRDVKVGVIVICIDDRKHPYTEEKDDFLVKGEQYTISNYDVSPRGKYIVAGIMLKEAPTSIGFDPRRFKKHNKKVKT